jgi:hypothetical protein
VEVVTWSSKEGVPCRSSGGSLLEGVPWWSPLEESFWGPLEGVSWRGSSEGGTLEGFCGWRPVQVDSSGKGPIEGSSEVAWRVSPGGSPAECGPLEGYSGGCRLEEVPCRGSDGGVQ